MGGAIQQGGWTWDKGSQSTLSLGSEGCLSSIAATDSNPDFSNRRVATHHVPLRSLGASLPVYHPRTQGQVHSTHCCWCPRVPSSGWRQACHACCWHPGVQSRVLGCMPPTAANTLAHHCGVWEQAYPTHHHRRLRAQSKGLGIDLPCPPLPVPTCSIGGSEDRSTLSTTASAYGRCPGA